jgi:hypothetical protein
MHRAVLRIIAELERCPPEKVCINRIYVMFSDQWLRLIAHLVRGAHGGLVYATA